LAERFCHTYTNRIVSRNLPCLKDRIVRLELALGVRENIVPGPELPLDISEYILGGSESRRIIKKCGEVRVEFINNIGVGVGWSLHSKN